MKAFLFATIILFLLMGDASARVEERKFDTVEQEQQYKYLIDELRCLVCQNQNLADSNAALAQDLREQVYLMIKRGDSNETIINFMVSRYGDFVLYRPPLKTSTLMLWVGPFIIMLIAFLVVVQLVRKRQRATSVELSQSDREKVRNLLESEDDKK